jgi:hypothetical protein
MKTHTFIPVVLLIMLLTMQHTSAQHIITQTIRGIVVDRKSQATVPGASIIIRSTEPLKGTTSGSDGTYRITGVPIGRHTIECSFMGYRTIVIEHVIVSSAKELVLNFELEDQAQELGEVVISSYSRKDHPVNRMAVISARSFTPEETNRYAGSYGDPARMASNYAGVMTGRDNRNDIIIRGNSSMGIIWKLDDIEIPNPSHYAALGTTGGPITILNSNLLTNSDFLSGAFPAEFGNALAGVFDLKMRNGNNEKREHWLQTGWNGLEFGTEGPITKNHRSSYIAAYRYSILDILNRVGLDLGIDPKYQDMNIKLNFPYSKGRFNVLALGGVSSIRIFDEEKQQSKWMFDEHGENIYNRSAMGMIAVSNLHFFHENTRLQTGFSLSGSQVESKVDTFHLQQMTPFLKAGENSSETKYSFSAVFEQIIGKKSDLDLGVSFDIFDISYKDSTYRQQQYFYDTNADEILDFYRIFGQYNFKASDMITFVAGAGYQFIRYNNSSGIEPRLGIRWDISENQSLNAGFGMHSQMQPRMVYFVQTHQNNQTYSLTNTYLEFSKSRHYVLGHDYLINKHLRLKTELYYQELYDIPVKEGKGGILC